MVVVGLAEGIFEIELVDEFDQFYRVVGDATKLLVHVVDLVDQGGNVD